MNTNPSPTNAANDDLIWVAMQYQLGELSAVESAAFETRLLDDQSAREALSQAVELTMACRLAEAEIEVESLQPTEFLARPLVATHSHDARWMRPVGWLSLGTAACLAVLMGWQSWITQPLMAQHEAKTLAVATAWAEVAALDQHGESVATDALAGDTLTGEFALFAMGEGNGGESLESESTDDDALTPSWLLAALEAK
jgi:hypothetical protein